MSILKRSAAVFAAVAMTIATSMTVFATPVKAAQYYTGRFICSAQSPSAWGVGAAYDRQQACNIALYQCAARTPSYQTCVVTRVRLEVAY